jgi:hypothetical protein
MDMETSGIKPEFALQPWRIPRGEAWVTSLVWLWPDQGKLKHLGGVMPAPEMTGRFLEWAIAEGRTICGWNCPYDISVAMALGYRDLCMKAKWLDGRLLWRHAFIEPESDDAKPKKKYGLKDFVREHLPQFAGYEADVDFHDTSPESLAKLHEYNLMDNVFTLRGCKMLWGMLTERQRQAALIEADCLPMVADANLQGLLIDTIAAQDLMLKLKATADAKLAALAPDGVTEKVVRSPKQRAALLFDQWGLPPGKTTATGARSTDKEVLYELAFIDPRAKMLRDWGEALNCSKKFAETPLVAARYNGDGRAHPLMMVFGTYSGRATYASKQKNRKGGKHGEDAAVTEAS